MNAAVVNGIQAALDRGARAVVILPGDVPLVSAGDVEALLDAAGSASRAVVVGASRDGQGTNALLLRPADVIAPAFGPFSAQRHARAGFAAAARVWVESDLDVALDIDTPRDLADLRAQRVGGRTARALARLSLVAGNGLASAR
jgi:2-phospho-L-lactate guanylyltransferase